jgi:hypothetical protein
MEPRLTRGEYWILETAVDAGIPLCFLSDEHYEEPDGLELMFNKPGHGLDCDALVSTLTTLFQNGLIEAKRNDEPCHLDESGIRDAIEEKSPLNNPSCTYYRLKLHGAAVWEQFAAPQWERFILEEFQCSWDENENEPCPGVATCMTPWRLRKYLENLYLAGREVDATSVEIKECGPWRATYWKELPLGHQARFNWRRVDGESSVASRELYWMAFGGFCEFRDEWYRWR